MARPTARARLSSGESRSSAKNLGAGEGLATWVSSWATISADRGVASSGWARWMTSPTVAASLPTLASALRLASSLETRAWAVPGSSARAIGSKRCGSRPGAGRDTAAWRSSSRWKRSAGSAMSGSGATAAGATGRPAEVERAGGVGAAPSEEEETGERPAASGPTEPAPRGPAPAEAAGVVAGAPSRAWSAVPTRAAAPAGGVTEPRSGRLRRARLAPAAAGPPKCRARVAVAGPGPPVRLGTVGAAPAAASRPAATAPTPRRAGSTPVAGAEGEVCVGGTAVEGDGAGVDGATDPATEGPEADVGVGLDRVAVVEGPDVEVRDVGGADVGRADVGGRGVDGPEPRARRAAGPPAGSDVSVRPEEVSRASAASNPGEGAVVRGAPAGCPTRSGAT